ncbi:MAG TPA: hypothetical protein VFJ82_03655 [Longimicrobium sp.]|nr:hypothetical protein [Longimicrobium sp.]
MLALLVAVPAAAQERDADAEARSFINALNTSQWDAAAGMVLPATAECHRRQALVRFVAVAEHRARGELFVDLGMLPDSADPTRLAALASTRLFRFHGAQTLGDAAKLSPRAFMASTLQKAFAMPPGAEEVVEWMWPRYIGIVVENDTLAHALYRVTGAQVRSTDLVVHLPLRRVDGRWYVTPGSFTLGAGGLDAADEIERMH